MTYSPDRSPERRTLFREPPVEPEFSVTRAGRWALAVWATMNGLVFLLEMVR